MYYWQEVIITGIMHGDVKLGLFILMKLLVVCLGFVVHRGINWRNAPSVAKGLLCSAVDRLFIDEAPPLESPLCMEG
jgi:hypothetical protein